LKSIIAYPNASLTYLQSYNLFFIQQRKSDKSLNVSGEVFCEEVWRLMKNNVSLQRKE